MSYAETLTLDQLRVMTAIIDAGSFSAAARQLQRSQSAISYQIAAMETALELELFNRSRRRPQLTEEGRAIAREARAILAQVSHLRAMSRSMRDGLEPRLSIAVDALFPMQRLTRALLAFRQRFPEIPLELQGGVRSAVSRDVDKGDFDVGITGDVTGLPENVTAGPTPLLEVTLVPVASRDHPLADRSAVPIAGRELARHVHVVLRERGSDTTLNIASPGDGARIWRMSDHDTRMALVEAGLGWSRVPLHTALDQLESGALVELDITPLPSRVQVPLHVIHKRDRPPGPAARWLFEQLAEAHSQIQA